MKFNILKYLRAAPVIIEREVPVNKAIVAYTIDAEEYKKTVDELTRQLNNERNARIAAEQAAKDYIIKLSDQRKLNLAVQTLTALLEQIR